MLQWMGGARRNVASTRKSTQKRQKQYFEQRRRQQQAGEGGKDSDGNSLSGKHTENNRSLDILSLLNLSTVAQETKSNCPLASNESEHGTLNCQTVQPPQAIGRLQINDIKSPVPSAFEESRSSSHCQPGNAYPKTTSIGIPANHARPFNSESDKMNQLKVGPEYGELHIIDILGDDDPNFSSCKSLGHEAHAAFSIEGLGEVEMETPVHTPAHSPEACGRTFLHGWSSPSKATKSVQSFNLDNKLANLEYELDTMMREVDVSLHKSSMQRSLGSNNRLGLFCEPKQGLFDSKEFSLFNETDNNFTDLLGDDEPFYCSRESKSHIWDATSSSLPHDILDESAFGLSYNQWMDRMDGSAEYFSSMDYKKKEFTFQGSYQPKSRNTLRESGKLERTDSPASYLKHQMSENFHNFEIPDTTWHSPVRGHYDVRDVVDQPAQSRYTNEDARENMSLLSEESCSSSAVRGVSKKGTLNSHEKQTFKSVDVARSDDISSEYNMSGWEEKSNKWKISPGGENITGQLKFTGTSNPLRSKPAYISKTTSEKRLKSDNGRLFEIGFGRGKASSDQDSYFQRSETAKPSSCISKLWTEDLFGTSEDPTSYDSGSYFERFSKSSAARSPCCNFKSEKQDFHQPKSKNGMLGSSMLNDCDIGYRYPKSSHEQSGPASEQQSTTQEAVENPEVYATEHGKCVPESDISQCRKNLSLENGKSRDAADIEDKSSDCKEFTDGASKVEGVKDMNCLDFAEENSPAAETFGMIDANRCHVDTIKLDAQTSLLCQTGIEGKLEIEAFCPEEGKTGNERQKSIDSRCQVMMLDSHVLQFLCIQVRKEASAQVTGKQA